MGRRFELDLEFVSQPRGAVSTLRNVKLLKKVHWPLTVMFGLQLQKDVDAN